MTLLDLQNAFRDVLLSSDDALIAPFEDDASAGMAVYRNAYRSRLMDCLRTSFDKVWSWVGDDAFDAAARHHIILTPPHSWTLDDYGAGFDKTLASLFPDDPEVAELASLEWAMQRAFACLDGPVIKPADLISETYANYDWDNATFKFVGSLQMRAIKTNCTGIWLALSDETDPPEQIALDPPAMLSVWRKAFSPQFLVLDQDEHQALSMAVSGASFGQICETLANGSSPEDAAGMAGKMLGRWIGDEMIASVQLVGGA